MSRLELGQPALDHAVDEVALGLEVVQQAALGDLGLGGDGVERQRLRAVAADDGARGVEQLGARVASARLPAI